MGEITTYGMAATKLGVAIPSGKTSNECGSKQELNSVFNLDQGRLSGYANNELVMIDDIVSGTVPYQLSYSWMDGTTNLRRRTITSSLQNSIFEFKTNAKDITVYFPNIGGGIDTLNGHLYINGVEIRYSTRTQDTMKFIIDETTYKNIYNCKVDVMVAANTTATDKKLIFNSVFNDNGLNEYKLTEEVTQQSGLMTGTCSVLYGASHQSRVSSIIEFIIAHNGKEIYMNMDEPPQKFTITQLPFLTRLTADYSWENLNEDGYYSLYVNGDLIGRYANGEGPVAVDYTSKTKDIRATFD